MSEIKEDSIRNCSKEYICNNIEDYIKNRLIKQIRWHHEKSVSNQALYKKWSVVGIIINAIVPILVLLLDLPITFYIRVAIAALSGMSAIIFSILALCKYQDLWIRYRVNSEELKSIYFRYRCKAGEYHSKTDIECDKMLVEQTEALLTKEVRSWKNIHENAPPKSI